MTERVQEILCELKARLTELYGERLEKLILFGSQARGDAEPDSDIDVLVVLKGDVDVGRELWRVSEITSEISLANRTQVTSVVMPVNHYGAGQSPFLMNVASEGVAV
ncbi:nucleotidyltransferase domain-containing protein [bacterium]|nr:nucleotidyltransferase domain-containing protein [bacterium]MBU1983709.1 nucleotidyltransferase domain-containing protein [bacterium]